MPYIEKFEAVRIDSSGWIAGSVPVLRDDPIDARAKERLTFFFSQTS